MHRYVYTDDLGVDVLIFGLLLARFNTMNQTPRKIKAGTPQMDGSDGFTSGALGYSLVFFFGRGALGLGALGLLFRPVKLMGLGFWAWVLCLLDRALRVYGLRL